LYFVCRIIKLFDANKTNTRMAIVKPLKQFAEERILDLSERNGFLEFCDSIKVRTALVVDVTSFEDYWRRYVIKKEQIPKKK